MDKKLTRKLPIQTMSHYILVDSENLLPDVLDYGDDTAIIFFVNHEKRLSVQYLADLQCQVIFESIQSDSKNALDFLIISYLTEMVMTIPSEISHKTSIGILSEDRGFDCIIAYLQSFYPYFELYRCNNAGLYAEYGCSGEVMKAIDYKNPELMQQRRTGHPIDSASTGCMIEEMEDAKEDAKEDAEESANDEKSGDGSDLGYSQEIKVLEKEGMVFLFPILKKDANDFHIVGNPTVEIADLSAINEAKRIMMSGRNKSIRQEMNEIIPMDAAIYRAEELSRDEKFVIRHFFHVSRKAIETGSVKSIHKKYCSFCQERGVRPLSRKKFKRYAFQVCRLSTRSINGVDRFYDISASESIRSMADSAQMKKMSRSLNGFFDSEGFSICQKAAAECYEKYLVYCRIHHEPAASQKLFEQKTMDHYGYIIQYRKRNKNLSVACFEPSESTIKKYITEFLDKNSEMIEGNSVTVLHGMLAEHMEQYHCDSVTAGRLNREIRDFFGYEVINRDGEYIYVSNE